MKRYLYDVNGNLECIVLNAWTNSSCPAVITGQAPDTNLVSDTIYDYKNRLAGYRAYSSGTLTDSAAYSNDPLDRPIQQTETHSGATTNTTLRYVGVANAVDQEVLTGATTTTKSYAYDAAGRKLALTDTASGSRYSYAYDPHGSISLLLNQSSTVKESYGYSAYGGANSALSKTAAGFDNKTNPYRYTGKRFDTGSGSYDMGARRYNPATGRFLQQDLYTDALDNLDLATDPLTGNRYAFTAATPSTRSNSRPPDRRRRRKPGCRHGGANDSECDDALQ